MSKTDMLTIFVGGFGPFVSETDIVNYFQTFGVIMSIVLKKDSNKGINKGYCFITVDSVEAVRAILTQNHFLDGRQVDCAVAHSGTKKNDDIDYLVNHRVCVKGLSKDITQED